MYKNIGKKLLCYKKRWIAATLSFLIFTTYPLTAYAADPLGEVRNLINTYYVNPVPQAALDATTPQDAVKALGDPYSEYFTSAEYKGFTNDINGKFVGIGVTIDMTSDGVKIVSLIDGSPAKEAGIKEGDLIIEADGHALAGLSSEEAASYLRGEEGTTVVVKVKRASETITFSIVRREITMPTVQSDMIGDHVGYIDISSFGETTAAEFKNELNKVEKMNPASYIIDLRYNGGGYMNTAFDIASYFIGDDSVLRLQSKGAAPVTYYAPGADEVINKPVIFLVNEYTASASEILSAAVKDHKKAFFIGNKTYGKGVAQSLIPLTNGDYLKLTTQKFTSPLGNEINKVGIQPDLKMNAEDSLAAAVLLLQRAPYQDHRGYVRVTFGTNQYFIDMNKGREAAYWNAFRTILQDADSIEIGNTGGWTKKDIGNSDLESTYIYSNYTSLSGLSGVAANKKFTLSFSSAVDAKTIGESNIELIDDSTGDRIPLQFQQKSDKAITAVPQKLLENGKTYYLVINNNIKNKNKKVIQQGVIDKITVAK